MRVKTAIIPAAGLGTRLLPATKALPKEMLPIVDKPTIQYIVEEAVQSGIENIIIVTGKGKRAIEDHFDTAFELETRLKAHSKHKLLQKVRHSSQLANIYYVRQKEPRGLGDAIQCAQHFIENEPFAVLLGDDIVQAEKPCLQQLIEQFERVNRSIIGVQRVPAHQTHRYGIIAPAPSTGSLLRVEDCIEKPTSHPPSHMAIMGRYIFTPDIFTSLAQTPIGRGNEIQLTDAIRLLIATQDVFAYPFSGTRYDVGEKLGFITTNVEMALQQPELRDNLLHYLRQLLRTEEQSATLSTPTRTKVSKEENQTCPS
ncbi:UTP--glucose-1-phosphate uridylyltransferase GalU [Mechercharimyces sp. CAU 1602]|uniref:UTP--glucose-1-phosphate uridylyltransferase GalU n=1 Tax=Mechercharimyces sp. CAU 1602 TaxID=2973933 RepID=UPI00216143BA|nr:UTP--glucose-1-phosphate uridylyltransferase GalU [Mechercharimyces sp. CAU 1602]MCS1352303.1 UTP--glucose-1-phosphate uridylyltransferase GalU [Mechercharimyces sp. CAU 1602]